MTPEHVAGSQIDRSLKTPQLSRWLREFFFNGLKMIWRAMSRSEEFRWAGLASLHPCSFRPCKHKTIKSNIKRSSL